jgi:hypothetical protein
MQVCRLTDEPQCLLTETPNVMQPKGHPAATPANTPTQPPDGGRVGLDRLVAFDRNWWSQSPGTAGRNHRNAQSGAIGRPPERPPARQAHAARADPPLRSRATIRIPGHAASQRATAPPPRSGSNATIRRRSRSHISVP